MPRFLRNLLTALLLILASLVQAGAEVHVVAVGKGRASGDVYGVPEVRVIVDRPSQNVSLVLLDAGAVQWRVELTEGTGLSEIIRGGPASADSAVSLSGIPIAGAGVEGLPLVFQPRGRAFRALVAALTARYDTDRLHSFQATHQAYAGPLRVDRIDTKTPGLARDTLVPHLSPSQDLPADLRHWLETGDPASPFSVTFDAAGLSLTGPTGTTHFAPTADVPAVLLPVLGVYDPGTRVIYALTYGAEGYIYAVDTVTGDWEVITSLNGYDAAGLLYDPTEHLLIATGAFSRPGEIRVFANGAQQMSLFIPTTAFPGLTDLSDFGNEHGPPLVPVRYRDGWLLLQAQDPRDANRSRLYAVHVETRAVRLLRYQG